MAKNYWRAFKGRGTLLKLRATPAPPRHLLEDSYKKFVGERDGEELIAAVIVAAVHNKTFPRWITYALASASLAAAGGEIRSWDEVFGKPARFGTNARRMRRAREGDKVLHEVERLKDAGKKLTDEVFEEIGRSLAVGGKTKVKTRLRQARRVRAIREQNHQRQKISKDLRRENPN